MADAEKLTEGITYVIGKMEGLEAEDVLLPGEKTVASEFGDLPEATTQEQWKANSSVLRRIMGEGRPIRDLSEEQLKPGKNLFLRNERELLGSRGWVNRADWWYPPR